MSTGTVVTQTPGRQQFQGLFSHIVEVKVPATPGAITTGINVLEAVTVPGVALGDMVLSVGSSASLASIVLSAYVSATDTVTLNFSNNTAGTITPTAGAIIKVLIGRPTW